MATTTVEVDIDMEDIPNYELVDEICERMETLTKKVRTLTERQRRSVYEDFLPLAKAFKIDSGMSILTINLYDAQKMEYLSKVFDRYSLNELMNLLPDNGFKK